MSMRTIHIKGYASNINLLDSLSDNYEIDPGFDFDEPTTQTVPNIFFRFYESKAECTLEEAVKGYLTRMFGGLALEGQDYGYSEYTVEGFTISSARLGGHDLTQIIKTCAEEKGNPYLHILIDQINK